MRPFLIILQCLRVFPISVKVKISLFEFLMSILVTGKAIMDIMFLLISKPSKQHMRLALVFLKVTPRYSWVSVACLMNLCNLVEQVNELGIEGDIVECGVWRGGSAAVMARANSGCESKLSSKRKVWLFDSFAGLPPSTYNNGEVRKNIFPGLFKADVEDVRKILRTLNIPLDNIHICEGWFEDILGTQELGKLSLLHIDSDLYESIKVCLDKLYDRVSQAGFIVCNDYYSWRGAYRAVNDFLRERGFKNIRLHRVDNAVYFQK